MGAASFMGWRPLLPPAVELIAIQLPGRENRLREPPCNNLSLVIEGIVAEMEPLVGPRKGAAIAPPFSFFGHSFGALLAYECCGALQRAGLAGPMHLAVSGANPPNWPLKADSRTVSQLALERLRARFGWQCAEEVDEAIVSLALEVLGADLDMMLQHRFSEEPLAMPLTVLGATDDPLVSVEALRHWASFARSHALSLTTGGHFFFEAQKERIVRLLLAQAARTC